MSSSSRRGVYAIRGVTRSPESARVRAGRPPLTGYVATSVPLERGVRLGVLDVWARHGAACQNVSHVSDGRLVLG